MVLKYLSLRDLRNTPGALWRKLRGGGTVVVTSEGQPRALVIGVEPEELPGTLQLLERLRAQQAVSRMRAGAAAAGTATLDAPAIAAEIAAVRRAHSR